jgi:hypothetical protein
MYSQVDLTLIEALTRLIGQELEQLNPEVVAPKCEIQGELPSRIAGLHYGFAAVPRRESDESPLSNRLLYRIL